MDHILAPRNGGAMDRPDAVGKSSLGGRPPYVTIYLRTGRGIVRSAMFQTFGCGVSIACCSVLTELVTGREISDCRSLTASSIEESLNGIPEEKRFCAEMAIEALKDALKQTSNSSIA